MVLRTAGGNKGGGGGAGSRDSPKGNARPQSSLFAESLSTDPGLKNGTGLSVETWTLTHGQACL